MSLYATRLQMTNVNLSFLKSSMVRLLFIFIAAADWGASYALATTPEACPQPEIGSTVEQPAEIESVDGVLRVELRMRSEVDARGRVRYCYVSGGGRLAPTLRLHPGDWLVVELKNEITQPAAHSGMSMPMPNTAAKPDPCAGGSMVDGATNLHFHGRAVPPVCHQDEAVRTLVEPGEPAFEYRMRIPENTPPGLYWYHPHPHGLTKAQVLGGASGALIVEGIERRQESSVRRPQRPAASSESAGVPATRLPCQRSEWPRHPPVLRSFCEPNSIRLGS